MVNNLQFWGLTDLKLHQIDLEHPSFLVTIWGHHGFTPHIQKEQMFKNGESCGPIFVGSGESWF